jgi:hypothetical protein
MKMEKISVWIICVLSLFLAPCVQAVTIEPTKQTAILDPGTSGFFELSVLNNEDTTKFFVPEVDVFSVDSESGSPIFGMADVATKWIRVEPAQLTLAPGERGVFKYIVDIPEFEPTGGHYLALFARQSGSGGQVSIGSRAGSLLYLYVAGEAQESASKEYFFSEKKLFFKGENMVHLALINSGNVHLDPAGEIVLFDMWGNEVDRRPLNSEHHIMLPGGEWKKSFSFSDGLMGNQFGSFSVKANISYGYSEQIINLSSGFWYVPRFFLIIVAGLIGLIGLVFLIIFINKKKKRI